MRAALLERSQREALFSASGVASIEGLDAIRSHATVARRPCCSRRAWTSLPCELFPAPSRPENVTSSTRRRRLIRAIGPAVLRTPPAGRGADGHRASELSLAGHARLTTTEAPPPHAKETSRAAHFSRRDQPGYAWLWKLRRCRRVLRLTRVAATHQTLPWAAPLVVDHRASEGALGRSSHRGAAPGARSSTA